MASLVPQSVEWDSGGEHVQLCQIPVNPEDHSMFPKTRHPTLSTTDY